MGGVEQQQGVLPAASSRDGGSTASTPVVMHPARLFDKENLAPNALGVKILRRHAGGSTGDVDKGACVCVRPASANAFDLTRGSSAVSLRQRTYPPRV